ncbi:response regulator transcription factor [Microbacterium sp. LWO12-1.2]|uniref:response regulator transcription factor n=1 Tax=Microbacterium sp. LWO12-1.2 TaxID=3135261 RepID=UPI003412C2D7
MPEKWTRRVLFVEDQQIVSVLVGELLVGAGFVVKSVTSAGDALDLLEDFDPDVLVTDIELGSRPDGVELAMIARSLAPHLGVVFLTSFTRAATTGFGRTITGAVTVDKLTFSDPSELVAAIEASVRVDATPAPGVEADEELIDRLTPHQRRVLSLIAAGLSNREIAERSGASLRAVERSVSRVFDTLGVSHVSAINPRVAAANRYSRLFGRPSEQ